MEKVKSGQHIVKVTIGEMESLIQEAYKNGWESDGPLLQAVEVSY